MTCTISNLCGLGWQSSMDPQWIWYIWQWKLSLVWSWHYQLCGVGISPKVLLLFLHVFLLKDNENGFLMVLHWLGMIFIHVHLCKALKRQKKQAFCHQIREISPSGKNTTSVVTQIIKKVSILMAVFLHRLIGGIFL